MMQSHDVQASSSQNVQDRRGGVSPRATRKGSSGAAPAWWVVCSRELTDLWIGGKALILMLLFCLLLGGVTYVLIGDMKTPRSEMVYLALETTVAVAVFLSVILGVDSISGERERGTLEALLATPASRRQIVFGKFLAAVSTWPAALALSIPCVAVLSDGGDVFGQGLLWGALLGTLMVTSFAGLGMIISLWSNSNKTSLFVGLGMFLLFLMPTLFPWETQIGFVGRLLRRVNPMEANRHLLDKVIVTHWPLGAYWPWLASPVLFAILIYALLFWYGSPGLRLEGGKMPKFLLSLGRRLGLQ